MEGYDEIQADIDMESEAYQQQLEAERCNKEIRAAETDLLRSWFEWCREADNALRPRKDKRF
jgi:hypothetical protein